MFYYQFDNIVYVFNDLKMSRSDLKLIGLHAGSESAIQDYGSARNIYISTPLLVVCLDN
jgi:hypothetical protein